ncbi:hypothetical protein BDN70DRAFT_929664 [Pholiota conissans]|uniref:C2H2-type domain-containing protein n=1 Tax=Pholiota conissans TaxID=109636 RepID=A0A9P5Z9U2_9AGAR|nr:hypothetical protein BDN70DRAFT_929664 [Pholiota conissans]
MAETLKDAWNGAFQGQELPLPVLIQLRDHIFPGENNDSENSNSSESRTVASSPSTTTTTTTFDNHFLSTDGPNAQPLPQWYSQSGNAPNGFQPTPIGQDLPTTIVPRQLIESNAQPGVGPSTHFQHHTSEGTVYGVSQAHAERRHGNHPYAAAQRTQALMLTTSTGPATQPDIIPTHPVPVPVPISVPAPAPASQPGRADIPQFLLDPPREEQITCLYNNCTQGTFTGLRAWTHHLGTQHGVPAGATEGGICLYPGCGQQQKASFQRHIVSTHSGILYQCRQCSGKVSPRTDAMRRHCVEGAKAKATHRYFPRAPGVVYADEIRA